MTILFRKKHLWHWVISVFFGFWSPFEAQAQVFVPSQLIWQTDFSTEQMTFASDSAVVSTELESGTRSERLLDLSPQNSRYTIWHIPVHNARGVNIQITGESTKEISLLSCYNEQTSFDKYGEFMNQQYGAGQSIDLDLPENTEYLNLRFRNNLSNADVKLHFIKIIARSLPDRYTRTLTPGKLGTLCLPARIEDATGCGATLYRIAGKRLTDGEPSSIVFEETKSLGAGEPCVFLASAEQLTLKMIYPVDIVTEPQSVNGLCGVLDRFAFANVPDFENKHYYIVNSKNQIQRASELSGAVANRAYIDMDQVPEYHEEDQSAGARLMILDENGFSMEMAASTGIRTLRKSGPSSSSAGFSLSGCRCVQRTGLLIHDGKIIFEH